MFLHQGLLLTTCVAQLSFKMRKVYSVTMILKLPQLGPKIWSILAQEIRQSVSHGDFKSKIK